ncbi:MAG TPA: LysE family translocator [Candidatus Limnocylindrales bacterium]|nr:LysE family translocator [Candidatus Limnocylindrales bacterium]
MVSSIAVLSVSLLAVGLVLTPGPNTVYLVSRTISQGRTAGMAALLGIAAGSLIYLVSSAAGATALLMLVPQVLQGIKAAGTTYLLWLAWHSLRASPMAGQQPLEQISNSRLFLLGLATNLLNPTVALVYLSVLPQLIDSNRGHVALQGLILGTLQAVIMLAINCLVVLGAGRIAGWVSHRPRLLRMQRWLTSTVLGVMAVQMLTTAQ